MAEKPILLDLACGTGSLSVELSRLGYDVIGVDGSADMLSEAASKGAGEILWLCQDFSSLDLYGTVDAAVARSTASTTSPTRRRSRPRSGGGPLHRAGGVFVFDVNTPYKHREILGQNTFALRPRGASTAYGRTPPTTPCSPRSRSTFSYGRKPSTRGRGESFCERGYSHDTLAGILDRAGFELLAVYAGDTFDPVGETTQRAVYAARRRG